MMHLMLDAVLSRDRARLSSVFRRHVLSGASSCVLHPLQLVASFDRWSRALDSVVDVFEYGLDAVCVENHLLRVLDDMLQVSEMMLVVRVDRMLVCGHYGVVSAHEDEYRASLGGGAAPTVFFVDDEGRWVASTRDTKEVVYSDDVDAIRDILTQRKSMRDARTLLQIARDSDDDRSTSVILPASKRTTSSFAPPALAQTRAAALRFLRARCELEARAYPQYRVVSAALERELDALIPDLGMAVALLMDDASTRDFERRYPVVATEIMYALRSLLPMTTPRDSETESRRFHAFLHALRQVAV